LVADADEVIVSPPEPRGSASAIIVDQEGGFTAPTAAESLCHAGWTVQIITDLPFVAAKVDPTQVWFVRRRLKKAGVTLRGNSELKHDPGGWALVDTESGPGPVAVGCGERGGKDVRVGLAGEVTGSPEMVQGPG
jgi:hypothetical protein